MPQSGSQRKEPSATQILKESMSLTTLCVAQLFYAEINQSDWLLKVKWLVLTNQTTLCQHIIDYGTKTIITSTPVHR